MNIFGVEQRFRLEREWEHILRIQFFLVYRFRISSPITPFLYFRVGKLESLFKIMRFWNKDKNGCNIRKHGV